jgi:hypothetical protein
MDKTCQSQLSIMTLFDTFYVQARFKLDDVYRDMFLQMVGLRWKESKSRLVKAIRVAARDPDASNKLNMLKPDNIKNAQEWNDFVNEKLTDEFEVVGFILMATIEKYFILFYYT